MMPSTYPVSCSVNDIHKLCITSVQSEEIFQIANIQCLVCCISLVSRTHAVEEWPTWVQASDASQSTAWEIRI